MELKKNKLYELESKRPIFFGIGMIISLSLTLVAFEWKSPLGPVVDDLDKTIISCSFHELVVPDIAGEYYPPITKWSDDGRIFSYIGCNSNNIINCYHFTSAEEVFHTIIEEMPYFEDGMKKLQETISGNLNYPKQAEQLGIEGRVYVMFIVEKDGSLSNIEVMKGIGAGCDEEALRVMKKIPPFVPGKRGNKIVRVKMVLPITFKLQ